MFVVTGGAGFIGSAMIHTLNTLGIDKILVVDDLGNTNNGKWRNLTGLRFDDIVSIATFPELLENKALTGIEAIIHMGANSSTTETNADHLLSNNYLYTKRIAEWIKKEENAHVRFIYASSAATYGDGSAGYQDDISQLDQLRPLNMYGYSKHRFDLWAQRNNLFETATGLKFFNVYGPNEYHKGDMSSVVYKAFSQISEKGSVRLFRSHRPDYADGEQLRDFVYVRDCTAIIAWLLENPVPGLFNIGNGTARTFKDLVTATFTAMNRDQRIEYVPMPETLRDKYQYHTCADLTRLREAGYTAPMTTLEAGITEYVTNYLATPNPHFDANPINQ